jgi:hypothetical protein
LQGRVLVEFGIDRDGKPVSVTLVDAQADPILKDGALKFIRGSTYDVSSPDFDAGDSTPYRATIKFCLPDCRPFATFPNSNEITIRASPLPAQFRSPYG